MFILIFVWSANYIHHQLNNHLIEIEGKLWKNVLFIAQSDVFRPRSLTHQKPSRYSILSEVRISPRLHLLPPGRRTHREPVWGQHSVLCKQLEGELLSGFVVCCSCFWSLWGPLRLPRLVRGGWQSVWPAGTKGTQSHLCGEYFSRETLICWEIIWHEFKVYQQRAVLQQNKFKNWFLAEMFCWLFLIK